MQLDERGGGGLTFKIDSIELIHHSRLNDTLNVLIGNKKV